MTESRDRIRIPNLPTGSITDAQGNPTYDELTFRQSLVTSLQDNMGNEGLVAPSQTNNLTDPDPNLNFHIRQIQNNQIPNPITNVADQYSLQPGTIIYDETNRRILISILDISGVPKFMQVTLTAPSPAI